MGATGVFLEVATYEAPWCCTMRAGEGLARVAESVLFTDGDEVYLPFYFDSEAKLRFADGACTVEVGTEYPYQGNVTLHVRKSCAPGKKSLKFFTPDWVDDESCSARATAGRWPAGGTAASSWCVRRWSPATTWPCATRRSCAPCPPSAPTTCAATTLSATARWCSGCDRADEARLEADAAVVPLHKARYEVRGRDMLLSPLNDLVRMSEDGARASRKQVLFRP